MLGLHQLNFHSANWREFPVLPELDVPPWISSNLAMPALVGSACALGLLVAIMLVRKKRSKSQSRDSARQPVNAIKPAQSEFDPFVEGSASEKRVTFRRRGTAVRLFIRGPGSEKDPLIGYVLDRSSGGMAICAPVEFPNGTFLHVRPDTDSEASMWVKLEVRSARLENGDWHLGCRFTEAPPWSVLLQFG
jgi:PilZ domain